MRRRGRSGGVLGRVAAANPLARMAVAGAGLFFAIVAVASMGSAVLLPPSEAACRPELEVGDVEGLPPEAQPYVRFYIAAAEEYELGERGPSILASIHRIETGFGTNVAVSSAGAEGHMQFIPSTWAAYGLDANGDGEADPWNAEDAIHSAAHYLNASGAPVDWRGAIFAYNHAEWYVDEVLLYAERYGNVGAAADATTTTCETTAEASGPADLSRAVRLTEPRSYSSVPAKWGAYGQSEQFDTRLIGNLTYVLSHYNLRLIQGRSDPGSPSETHGHGTAADLAPAPGYGWDETALRLAEDLGWTRECGGSGERPACALVPAIANVYYDGFSGHGEGNHIHVGWQCACTYGGDTLEPAAWVTAFPSPSGELSTESPSEESSEARSAVALVVGDSSTVGAEPYLRERLGDQVEIDARVGRPSAEGLAVLRERLAPSHEIVAFDLGGNDDPAQAGALAENLAAARRASGDRCLVLSTVQVSGGSALNRVIERFASEADDVVLFDWHGIAERNPELLEPDGIHANVAGDRRRADVAIEAMQAC